MAYSTGSYTGINNVLNLFAAWAVTNGWTQNNLSDDSSKYSGDTFTGRRLHIQKSINGVDVFMNFRSSSNQLVSAQAQSVGLSSIYYYDYVTGISVNGSSEFTGTGVVWDKQGGYTPYRYLTTPSPTCGCLDGVKDAGGAYHFFATDTSLSMAVATETTYSTTTYTDWRFITVGTLNDQPFYSASGGGIVDGLTAYRSRYGYSGENSYGNGARVGVLVGSQWYTPNMVIGDDAYLLLPTVGGTNSQDDRTLGMFAEGLVNFSPDGFRGNVVLVPYRIFGSDVNGDGAYPIGDVEGVKFLNMTNYANEGEITIGSDTYVVFRISEDYERGVAFLK